MFVIQRRPYAGQDVEHINEENPNMRSALLCLLGTWDDASLRRARIAPVRP